MGLSKSTKHIILGSLSILGGCLHKIALSSVTTLLNFYPYLLSYLHKYHPNYIIEQGYFLIPVYTITTFLFAPIGGFLDSKLGMFKAIIIGVLLLLSAAFVMFISTNYYLDFISIILYGIGIGVSSMLSPKNACKYFFEKKGMVNAIIASLGSIGGGLYNLAGEMLINPKSIGTTGGFYPFEIAEKIKYFLLFQMCTVAIIVFVALVLIVPHDDSKNIMKDKINSIEPILDSPVLNEECLQEEVNIPNQNNQEYSIVHIKKAVTSWRAWRLFLLCFLSSFIIIMISTTYRSVGIALDRSTKVIQAIGTLRFVVNCICTPIWGVLTDFLNYRIILLIINIGCAALGYLYYFCLFSNFTFFVGSLMESVLLAGLMATIAPHIMKVFGMKYYIEIGGVIAFGFALGTVFSTIVSYLVTSILNNSKFGFFLMYVIGGGMATVAAVLGLFEDDREFEY